MDGEEFKEKNIWDLQYQSTSDDDDSRSEDEEQDESSSDEEEEPETQDNNSKALMFEKKVKGQGAKVPDIVKRLAPKKTQREKIRYQYSYKTENGELVGEEPK